MSPVKKNKEKVNPAILVAIFGLIGTIITAIFASPVLIALIERGDSTATTSPTAASPANTVLVFSEDFEDGVATGFSFDLGKWSVVKDKSNRVLELRAITPSDGILADAPFGPSEFGDGIIELQVKFIEFGNFYLFFREQSGTKYTLYVMHDQIILGYLTPEEQIIPINETTIYDITLEQDTWYTLRLEARKERLIFRLDGNQIFSASDGRLQTGDTGLAADPGSVIYFDNIKIWSYEQ